MRSLRDRSLRRALQVKAGVLRTRQQRRDDMEPSQDLGELIRLEHSNIPPGAWGFFFPVALAVWRYVVNRGVQGANEVHAFWTDSTVSVANEIEVRGLTYMVRRNACSHDYAHGPIFCGPGGQWLMQLLEPPEVVSAVEAVAYSVPHSINQRVVRSGVVGLQDIPHPDASLVARLEESIERRLGVSGTSAC